MAQTIVITVDGKTHSLDMGKMSALDAKEFRATVGVSLTQALANASADLDVIAGLIWMARRQSDPAARRLSYEEVAASLHYDAELDLDQVETNGKGPTDPET